MNLCLQLIEETVVKLWRNYKFGIWPYLYAFTGKLTVLVNGSGFLGKVVLIDYIPRRTRAVANIQQILGTITVYSMDISGFWLSDWSTSSLNPWGSKARSCIWLLLHPYSLSIDKASNIHS
jgi:hypothetical protein